MSHSPVTHQDVQEASNGVDTSGSPRPSDWSHCFSPQELKFNLRGDYCVQEPQTEPSLPSEPTLHRDSCRETHTLQPHTDHPSTASLIKHTPNTRLPMEDGTHRDSHLFRTDMSHAEELVEWKEEGKMNCDEGVNLVTNTDVTQRKEKTTSVQPVEHPPPPHSEPEEWSNSDSSSLPDEVQPTSSVSPDETPPLVPAPPPDQATAPLLPDIDDSPCPTHVMAEVRVRSLPERERVVRGMQDSKSLDEISGACCGGGRGGGARSGQQEGRRATISSALELEGTVSHDGDLTHFITKNLEQKIKMSSRPSLDTDSDCSGPVVRGRGSLRRPADIPPIDPSVLLDLHKHTQEVAQSVELMLRSLSGTIQNMTALSVGYIQTYRDSVDSLGESVDMSIKGMYTLMARCEELDRSMQPIHALAAQIRDIKQTLDALENICK